MTSLHASTRQLADALMGGAEQQAAASPRVRGADWRRGEVTAVGTDGTVEVDGVMTVRLLETAPAPVVGDWLVITRAGSGNWLGLGRLASSTGTAWTTASLASGYTHNGNSNGNIRYRRFVERGTAYLEWDGSASRTSGSATSNILSSALSSGFRPANRASFVIARNSTSITGVANSTSVVHSLKVDFDTDGTVSLVSAAAGDQVTSWFSLKGIRYPLD